MKSNAIYKKHHFKPNSWPVRRPNFEMIQYSNAKINLGLAITEKRSDGFHNIESVFYPIGWSDILEIIPSENLAFTSSGIEIPGDPDKNLCLKAFNLIQNDFKIPNVKIHLHKIIPIGAGLGGGSSNASNVILMLNEIFDLKLSTFQMQEYARKIGSDCAFFIENKPMFCFDKGDQFKEIDLDLSKYFIVLIYPNLHISTQTAYSGVKPSNIFNVVENEISQPIHDWKFKLKNDFETSLFPKFEVLKSIKNELYDLGAIYASMSGSGSTMFGIFEKETETSNKFDDFQVWKGKMM